MKNTRILIAIAVAVGLLTPTATLIAGETSPMTLTQSQDRQGSQGQRMQGQQGMQDGAMMQDMRSMNQRMAQHMRATGDPDREFAQMMIPHHQGAIEMAKVLLERGQDPELRKMAETIIKDQEQEIAQFQGWLKRHQ